MVGWTEERAIAYCAASQHPALWEELMAALAFSARSRGSLKLFHWAGVTWVVDWMR